MSKEMYGWDRCTHEGIGMPGCRTCDPDKFRVAERYELLLSFVEAERDDVRVRLNRALKTEAAANKIKHAAEVDRDAAQAAYDRLLDCVGRDYWRDDGNPLPLDSTLVVMSRADVAKVREALRRVETECNPISVPLAPMAAVRAALALLPGEER